MSKSPQTPLLYTLFAASGAAGLIYELVWTRELALLFGGTTHAISTVLVAFMTGLGLGSYLAGRLAARIRRPGRLYGILEIAIAFYGLSIPVLLDLALPLYRSLNMAADGSIGVVTAARFLVGSLVLLMPATLMGATLPTLVLFLQRRGALPGRSVAHLYGINTLGAVAGSMVAGFFLIEALGLAGATRVAAGINLVVGAISLRFLHDTGDIAALAMASGANARKRRGTASTVDALSSNQRALVLAALGLSGLTAMAYQIAWTRALVMCVGSSTYAFASILATFILGIGLGSLMVSPWVDRWSNRLLLFGIAELSLGAAAIAVKAALGQFPLWAASLVSRHLTDYSQLLALQFAAVAALLLIPTLLMGAIMPVVVRLLSTGEDSAAATGRVYAVNTAGAVAGSFLAGFFLIRSGLGIEGTIVLAAAINAVLGAALILSSGARWRQMPRILVPVSASIAVPLVGALAGAWVPEYFSSAPFLAGSDPRSYREGTETVYYQDGVDLTVAVNQNRTTTSNRALTVNGKADASNDPADMGTQLLLGHLPATLLPEGEDVCVIGLGGGFTLAAVARHPRFRSIECVEISAEVIEAARAWFSPFTYDVLNADPRVRMIRGDGRNHLLLNDRTYDLIISEPSNPWIAGVSNLFTREFFEICESRLSSRGLCCVWLHSYMMTSDNFRMVVRTLCEVFPEVSVWQCSPTDYVLIASPQELGVPLDRIRDRWNVPAVRADLFRIGTTRLEQLLGCFVAGGEGLRAWALQSPVVNTDDNAALEFAAPRSMYQRDDFGLALDLYAAGGSPFDRILQGAFDHEEDQEIRARTETLREARRAYSTGMSLAVVGETARSMRILIQSYRNDPANTHLYRVLVKAQQGIRRRGIPPHLAAELEPALREVDLLVPPPIQQSPVETLDEVRDLLRQRADEQRAAGHVDWAAEYLSIAREFAPTDPDLVIEHAAALKQAGRAEEATGVLVAALADGTLSEERLAAHDTLRRLIASP